MTHALGRTATITRSAQTNVCGSDVHVGRFKRVWRVTSDAQWCAENPSLKPDGFAPIQAQSGPLAVTSNRMFVGRPRGIRFFNILADR
jgi:hypothetical protein